VSTLPPLGTEIRSLIKSAGPMPVSRYMELCLTHPQHGYYRDHDPLGREGDFITAPEVSQMFGELLGLWAAATWRAMDAPTEIQLIELGPGRGTMMADMLRAIRVVPALYQALSVHLVEINAGLREKQKQSLAGIKANVQWHDSIDDIPDGPALIFANEYFDALPIHQAVRLDDGWHERVVDLNENGQLYFKAADDVMPRFDLLLTDLVRAAPVGAIFEWRSPHEAMRLARRLTRCGGAALVIDYGHVRSDAGDTFQAIARHSFADPLKNPGKADLTAHVDFEALAKSAEDFGALVHGPLEQGTFLKRLGIETRAATLANKASPSVASDITSALNRLTAPGREGMGSLFKVLGLSHPSLKTLAAFAEEPQPSGDAQRSASS
jgi:SAM-dependent MidA family methyltransferase